MKGVKCNTCVRFFVCVVTFHVTIKYAASVLATKGKKDEKLWTRSIYEKECTSWPNDPTALLWDILEKASILVQILGVDALALITIAMSFLRLDDIKKECRKLDECLRMLQVLLNSPTGRWNMSQQQSLELELTSALRDAQGLKEYYTASTLFLRIRKARSMARQFQDLHNKIDNYCRIIQANPPPLFVRVEINNGDQVSPSTGHSTDANGYSSAVSSPLITRYEVINGEETAEAVVVQEADAVAPARGELNNALVDEEPMITVPAVNEEAMAAANGEPVAEEERGPADVPPSLVVAARSRVQRRSPRLISKEDPNYVSILDRAMNLKRQQKEGSVRLSF